MPKKTIKFMIEFEHPEKGEGLSVRCPQCKAEPGDECTSYSGKRVPHLHHDRYAVFMNLDVISRGALYRIK